MTKICKYTLEVVNHQVIEVPIQIAVMSVQTQQGIPQMWAAVEEKSKPRQLEIFMFGTGRTIQDSGGLLYLLYLGTIQQASGLYVWHYFAKQDPEYPPVIKL